MHDGYSIMIIITLNLKVNTLSSFCLLWKIRMLFDPIKTLRRAVSGHLHHYHENDIGS